MLNHYFLNPLSGAISILAESTSPSRREELEIQAVLEDVNSPARNKYVEKLYDSVMSKAHIDFDNIPVSGGNIVEYVGYTNIIEVLSNIMKLASDMKSTSVMQYVETVQKSIAHMRALAPVYQKGFKLRNEYIMMEYNTYVYTIVQAVSTIIYEFTDFIKRPDRNTMEITLKNNKYRANTFYIEQLSKYNKIAEQLNYRKYLESLVNNGRDNFTGVEALGLAAVVSVALAIVPVTRELVYRFYNTKRCISDALAQQAYFLEMNKAVIEANSDFNQKKKDAILIKQEKIKNMCTRLSEKLRVDHIKSVDGGRAAITADNKLLTIDSIKKEVSNSPLNLL